MNTVADAISLAPAVSPNTALNTADEPLPAFGVSDVCVTTGAGTVHEPICCKALVETPDPAAVIQRPFTPVKLALKDRGNDSVRALPLLMAVAAVASREHCVASAT